MNLKREFCLPYRLHGDGHTSISSLPTSKKEYLSFFSWNSVNISHIGTIESHSKVEEKIQKWRLRHHQSSSIILFKRSSVRRKEEEIVGQRHPKRNLFHPSSIMLRFLLFSRELFAIFSRRRLRMFERRVWWYVVLLSFCLKIPSFFLSIRRR